MKKLIAAFMLVGIAVPFCKAQTNCSATELSKQLIAMKDEEQAIRKELMPALAKFQEDGSGQLEMLTLVTRMKETDQKNQQALVEILESCGWSESLDKEAHNAVFLILQHSPDALMQQYYPQVLSMAEKGLLELNDAATMEDRLLMNAGKAQKYGTQTFSNQQNQNMVWPIESLENLAALRKSVGLPTMQEYFKLAKDSFNIEMIWNKELTLEEANKEKR